MVTILDFPTPLRRRVRRSHGADIGALDSHTNRMV
jgi:hypothetical protein